MTRAEIEAAVIRWLNEEDTPHHWTLADIREYITIGMEEYNKLTLQNTSYSAPTLTTANLYDIPDDCQMILGGWYDTIYPLAIDSSQLLAQRTTEDSGTPTKIVRDQREGAKKYRLHPNVSDTDKDFELIYLKRPAALTTATDEPVFREPHRAIVYFCLYRCFSEEGLTYDEQKAQKFYKMFEEEAYKTGANNIGPEILRTTPFGYEYDRDVEIADDYRGV